MIIERQNKDGSVDNSQAGEAVGEFFAQNDYTGKRILVIIPDNTRSGPIGNVFKLIYDCLENTAKAKAYYPIRKEKLLCNQNEE